MITTPPAPAPVTIPVEATVAIAVLLLAHVPLAEVSANAVVLPTHAFPLPVIGPGATFTETTLVTEQFKPENVAV